MRASVACERCRKSKTKCENDGLGTECKACRSHPGRTCTYPPATASHSRRDSTISSQPSLGTHHVDGEAPRKRQKRIAPSSHSTPLPKRRAASADDPLDPEVLNWTAWNDLLTIFRRHYSADLLFLHPPTFLDPNTKQPHASKLLLLAFLTLTAPFHEGLVRHHSADPSKPKPRAASYFYYNAAMAELRTVSERPTLDRIQALLMLGLYEWGTRKGIYAWQHIGNAVRSAQVLGLHVNEGRKNEMVRKIRDTYQQKQAATPEDRFIQEEIKRRTFWSCFILDRYTSGGLDRPSNINLEDVSIQLPCSDRAFQSGTVVRTSRLTPDLVPDDATSGVISKYDVPHSPGNGFGGRATPDIFPEKSTAEHIPWERGSQEGVLCHYIRAMELLRHTLKWSLKGGRRNEKVPPWDRNSFVSRTEEKLEQLKGILGDYTFTPLHTRGYLSEKGSSTGPYILIHALHLLCIIILHREYIPWVALNCQKEGPTGPKDPPRFPLETWGHQEYWVESATKLFKAARDLTDLMWVSEQYEILVETSLSFFCLYQVMVCSVYALHYPYMDPGKHITHEVATKGFRIIHKREAKLSLVHGWVGTILRLDDHFRAVRKQWARSRKDNSSQKSSDASVSSDNRVLTVGEGGEGGDLPEYIREWEENLKEFGNHREDYDGSDSDQDHPHLEGDVKGPEELSDTEVSETPVLFLSPLPIRPDAQHNLEHDRTGFTAVNGVPKSVTASAEPSVSEHMLGAKPPLKYSHADHVSLSQPSPLRQNAYAPFEQPQYGPHPPDHYVAQSPMCPHPQTSELRNSSQYPAQPNPDGSQDWQKDDWHYAHTGGFGAGYDIACFVNGDSYGALQQIPREYPGPYPATAWTSNSTWTSNNAHNAN